MERRDKNEKMVINKTCSHCGANITAEDEAMKEALNTHKEGHIEDYKNQIKALEEKIEQLENED